MTFELTGACEKWQYCMIILGESTKPGEESPSEVPHGGGLRHPAPPPGLGIDPLLACSAVIGLRRLRRRILYERIRNLTQKSGV